MPLRVMMKGEAGPFSSNLGIFTCSYLHPWLNRASPGCACRQAGGCAGCWQKHRSISKGIHNPLEEPEGNSLSFPLGQGIPDLWLTAARFSWLGTAVHPLPCAGPGRRAAGG